MTPTGPEMSNDGAGKVPDMIPGRATHRQAAWYRLLAVVAAVQVAERAGPFWSGRALGARSSGPADATYGHHGEMAWQQMFFIDAV